MFLIFSEIETILLFSSYLIYFWKLCLDLQLGCGAVTLDYLAAVDSYPNPDDKIRSTSAKVE